MAAILYLLLTLPLLLLFLLQKHKKSSTNASLPPVLGFIDRLNGLASRLDKNFKECDAFYQEIIDEHLDPDRAKPEQEDILDILLQLWKDRSFKVQLTFDNIKALLMNIFIGGTDTGAATVSEDLDMDVLPGLTMHKKNALCLIAINRV
ncbi:unnamed protein product [Linum trigynum]|uniref:Cytochrome P450 n=1 Tax=Linum trigynum TaxID=586398 RepID=A0AAV2CGT5_9ROSI